MWRNSKLWNKSAKAVKTATAKALKTAVPTKDRTKFRNNLERCWPNSSEPTNSTKPTTKTNQRSKTSGHPPCTIQSPKTMLSNYTVKTISANTHRPITEQVPARKEEAPRISKQ